MAAEPPNRTDVFTPQLGGEGEPCPTCATPLAADQRYCLACGERRAEPRLDFMALLGSPPFGGVPLISQTVEGVEATAVWEANAAAVAEPVAATASNLPGPRSLAFAGLSILVAGALFGAAFGPPASESLAAGRGLIIVQATPTPAPTPDGANDGGASSAFDSGSGSAVASSADTAVSTGSTDSSSTTDTTSSTDMSTTDTTTAATSASIGHVAVLMLPGRPGDPFAKTSPAGYLRDKLPKLGTTLTRYHAIGHGGLVNRLALISGQGPNPQTQAGCPTFSDFGPATDAPDGQFSGAGCAYPAKVKTIADQVTKQGLTWQAYIEGMTGQCAKPEPGAVDPTVPGAPVATTPTTTTPTTPTTPTTTTPSLLPVPTARVAQAPATPPPYTTSTNPFAYFRSLTDTADCRVSDGPLTQLATDLKQSEGLANFVYVAPAATASDPATADTFLAKWVPKITYNAQFKRDGMLVVTFDEATAAPGVTPDSAACCNEQPGPNVTDAGGAPGAQGGGRVGAVVISPYVKPGSKSSTPYNHYALLRTIEDRLGLGHLGFAASTGPKSFGTDIFTRELDAFAAPGAAAASARTTRTRPTAPARRIRAAKENQ